MVLGCLLVRGQDFFVDSVAFDKVINFFVLLVLAGTVRAIVKPMVSRVLAEVHSLLDIFKPLCLVELLASVLETLDEGVGVVLRQGFWVALGTRRFGSCHCHCDGIVVMLERSVEVELRRLVEVWTRRDDCILGR